MADSEDLKRLESGELDLSRCDFREAQLSGLDLRGRNFSHCLLKKANCEGTQFSGSNFQDADVSFIKAANAVFDECNLEGSHFGYTDLSGASLQNASANRAIFQHAILNGADLRGISLRDGTIDADTKLEGVISDHNTNFDGLRVLRPTSRDALFKDYTFDNGKLRRQFALADLKDTDSSHNLQSPEKVHLVKSRELVTTTAQIQHLLQNANVTRFTAKQFAGLIEDALREVPPTDNNRLIEPLQTMLEFAEVLRKLAPDTLPPGAPFDLTQLESRIAELEAIIGNLTQQLSHETSARQAAEALNANGSFTAHFLKTAGKASGTAAVAVATSLVTVGVPTAAVYFLGSENPVVTSFLTVIGRLPK